MFHRSTCFFHGSIWKILRINSHAFKKKKKKNIVKRQKKWTVFKNVDWRIVIALFHILQNTFKTPWNRIPLHTEKKKSNKEEEDRSIVLWAGSYLKECRIPHDLSKKKNKNILSGTRTKPPCFDLLMMENKVNLTDRLGSHVCKEVLSSRNKRRCGGCTVSHIDCGVVDNSYKVRRTFNLLWLFLWENR